MNFSGRILDIFPHLNSSGSFICKDLSHRDSNQHYRVPVKHRPLGTPGEADDSLLSALPELPTFNQLRTALRQTGGLTFFVPELWQPEDNSKQSIATLGSLYLYPPEAWDEAISGLRHWVVGEETWDDLPYEVDDILVIVQINYSPDCWFTPKRGPLAGQIFHWKHDDASDLLQPWATDLRSWGNRVWSEVPGLLGGIIRFATPPPLILPPPMRSFTRSNSSPEANVNAIDDSGQTMLMIAATRGDAGVLKLLLAADADAGAKEKAYGFTPLHYVADAGKRYDSGDAPAIIDRLVKAGASLTAVDTANDWTPFQRAAAHGTLDILQKLLALGADPKAKDPEGQTPAQLAKSWGDAKVAAHLKKLK